MLCVSYGGLTTSQPPDVYVMEVHIFGATSSPCVANLILRKTATDNAKKFSPEVAAVVEKNFYVDDALPSFSSDVLATRAAADLAEMLRHGGFRLRKVHVKQQRNFVLDSR